MADITSVYQTYNNSGSGVAQADDNYGLYKNNQADVGREYILSVTADAGVLTNAKLDEAVKYLTTNHYTSSNTDGSAAGTIAAIGTATGAAYNPASTTVVYVKFQTTEAFAITDFNANDTTGVTLAIVSVFAPAL